MPKRIGPGQYGAVGVSERSPGTWVARVKYRDPGGELHYLHRSGATEAEARRWLTQAMGTNPGDRTVSDVIADFTCALEEQVRLGEIADTTAARYRYCLPNIKKRLGALPVRDLTSGHVTRFLRQLALDDKLSPSSRRQHRTVLSKMLRPLVQDEAIPRNPIPDTDQIRGSPKSPRALSKLEVRRLLSFLDSDATAQRRDLGDLVRFMLFTGCRIGEALALRWQDVRFGTRPMMAEILGNIVEVTGQGTVRHHGKTTAAVRDIELIPPIAALIERRWNEACERRRPEPSDPVFYALSRPGKRYVYRRPSAVHGWIRQVRAAVDLAWMTSHSWRKTTVTILHDLGYSDRDIGRITGHSSLTTLRNVYIGRGEQNPNIAPALASAYAEWTAPLELDAARTETE